MWHMSFITQVLIFFIYHKNIFNVLLFVVCIINVRLVVVIIQYLMSNNKKKNSLFRCYLLTNKIFKYITDKNNGKKKIIFIMIFIWKIIIQTPKVYNIIAYIYNNISNLTSRSWKKNKKITT